MSLPKQVKLVEVSPRDGLQNETQFIPTETKVALIKQLRQAGLSTIEVTSFVSHPKIPQLADAAEVMSAIKHDADSSYPVLVPNIQGYNDAIAAGARSIAVFTAASEAFNQKNINCGIEESFSRFEPVLAAAKKQNIPVRGYISCVLGCPYQGEIKPEQVSQVAKRLWQMGCQEISLGDTIGVGTPGYAVALIKHVSQQVPLEHLAVHFHDTYGQALANIYACLEQGISTVDASVAGLGGCPYAKGATGNVATEDVLYMLDGLAIKTGVDLQKLITAGILISDALGRPTRSKVASAIQ